MSDTIEAKLEAFVPQELLSSNIQTKSLCFLGDLAGNAAIVTLTRAPLPNAQDILDKKHLPLDEVRVLDTNDIYAWGLATVNQDLDSNPGAKVDLICPATDAHIAKYRQMPQRAIVETSDMYERAVVPYINKMRGPQISWVRAILREGAEADRVLLRDHDPEVGFVLLPNSKWDRQSLESLYLLVIVEREDLFSIRDLTAAHIPLIKNIRDKTHAVVQEKYGLEPTQIKLYFHYQPSYYHLHVHVANVNMSLNDFGRSILLDTLLDMLAVRPEGLRSAPLSYIISEGHQLWRDFQALA